MRNNYKVTEKLHKCCCTCTSA